MEFRMRLAMVLVKRNLHQRSPFKSNVALSAESRTLHFHGLRRSAETPLRDKEAISQSADFSGGSVKKNVAPLPGSLFTQTSPPCACTMCFNNREAQARAALLARPRLVHAVKKCPEAVQPRIRKLCQQLDAVELCQCLGFICAAGKNRVQSCAACSTRTTMTVSWNGW